MELTYEERCQAAATAQGLNPIMDAFNEERIPFKLDQLGGFCMGLRFECNEYYVLVTSADTPDDRYEVGIYRNNQEESDEGRMIARGATLFRTISLIVALLRGNPPLS